MSYKIKLNEQIQALSLIHKTLKVVYALSHFKSFLSLVKSFMSHFILFRVILFFLKIKRSEQIQALD